MGSLVVLLLAERAPSEGPRSTRAFEDQPGHPMKRGTSELGGSICNRGRSMREVGRAGVSLGQEAVDCVARNDSDPFDFWWGNYLSKLSVG